MMGGFHLAASVTVPHEAVDVLPYLWPVILACEEFEGFWAPWVPDSWQFVVVL